MLRFNRLRTKFAVLYAGLFGIISLIVAITVYFAAAGNATRLVRDELEANGAVFDRLWQMRSDQLRDSADLLARDFGFRDAIASADQPTIVSALENLRQRLKIQRAFFMDINGDIAGAGHFTDGERDTLWRALDSAPHASGILIIEGAPYQAIAAPVLAPDTLGWVVFAAALNEAQMHSFEQLAAIPIKARIFTRGESGEWGAQSKLIAADAKDYGRLLSGAKDSAQFLNLKDGKAIALALPLTALTDGKSEVAALVLSYPMALATAQYRILMVVVVVLGAVGMGLMLLGSWGLARSLTQPITALDDAAHRLQQGEEIQVAVQSKDEIGRLAESFNAMAAGIKRREQRIRQMGLMDSEVHMPNRRAFENALKARVRAGAGFTVAAIGIDRFQYMRGAIGYELSGALVRALAERLASMEPKVRAARLSADTLGVILSAVDSEAGQGAALEIQQALEAPLQLGAVAMDVVTTIGLSAPNTRDDVAALINQASVAVDQARKAHQKIAWFDAAAYGDPARNLALISELYAGIEKGEAFLLHQPKYDVRQGRITGAEALMRWKHPQRGMISPDIFITMAEETGNIRGLTEWVLERAIADQRLMRAAGHDLTISVNISGRLLSDAAFASQAIQAIKSASASICFEITETAVIDNPDAALLTLERCVKAGVKISIDDYGSGLSSLSYLKQIRAQELKIDKNFILAVDVSQRDSLMVKSTIDLAHSLGMKVVAEGVETDAALALLSGMGCDIAQGYLISRPVSTADLIALLSASEAQTIAAPDARRAAARA